ncbi:unnamed protein product, partial [Rotaria sp. Silwood1]
MTEWVCVSADTKNVYEEDGGNGKEFTTVVVCGNAAGVVLPPYTIYAAKAVNLLWCQQGLSRAQYVCSAKRWTNEDLFVDWLENLFIAETEHIPRPLLLVMDNLSSHISIKSIELALKHEIILLCLPPNTTHTLQPLDVVTFGSFSSSAISGGFRRAGILPWDGDAMKDKVVRRASSSNILTMNDSLASSILSSLVNEIRTPNVHTNNSNNSSSTNQMDIDLPPSSYRRQVTFDDESSDESDSDMGMYADSSTKQKPINIHYDSDEHLDSSSNQNNGDLASTSSSTSIQLRHTSAIRTIMSSYVRNNNESVQPKPVKLNRRVRIERKFGEDITNGNLLQELK